EISDVPTTVPLSLIPFPWLNPPVPSGLMIVGVPLDTTVNARVDPLGTSPVPTTWPELLIPLACVNVPCWPPTVRGLIATACPDALKKPCRTPLLSVKVPATSFDRLIELARLEAAFEGSEMVWKGPEPDVFTATSLPPAFNAIPAAWPVALIAVAPLVPEGARTPRSRIVKPADDGAAIQAINAGTSQSRRARDVGEAMISRPRRRGTALKDLALSNLLRYLQLSGINDGCSTACPHFSPHRRYGEWLHAGMIRLPRFPIDPIRQGF